MVQPPPTHTHLPALLHLTCLAAPGHCQHLVKGTLWAGSSHLYEVSSVSLFSQLGGVMVSVSIKPSCLLCVFYFVVIDFELKGREPRVSPSQTLYH